MADNMDGEDRKELIALRFEVTHLIKAVEELTKKFDGLATMYLTPASVETLRAKVAMLEKVVYSGIAIILMAVLAAVISLVIKK